MEDVYRIAALAYGKAGKEWEALKWVMKATEALIITERTRERMVRDMETLGRRYGDEGEDLGS